MRAAGAMCLAVDLVFGTGGNRGAAATLHDTNASDSSRCMSSTEASTTAGPLARTVFCCTRPPGHHAERAAAMGFCFLNNAGIGARHAQAIHGVERVAVLDFDVHHGNGTEDGFMNDPTLFYGSTHEQGNYPGTGPEPKFVGDHPNTEPKNRRIVDRFLPSGPSSVPAFRSKWRSIVEEMVVFAPGLVIFSAGFDAHKSDPLGGCDLLEADFVWATRVVMEACVRINRTNPPPCISVLEGGYNVGAISRSSLAHCKALDEGYPAPPAVGLSLIHI